MGAERVKAVGCLRLCGQAPLAAADQLVAARLLIQRVTARFGWRCSFSPLSAAERVGNGGHVHLSLRRAGAALLQWPKPPQTGLLGSARLELLLPPRVLLGRRQMPPSGG